MLIAIIQYNVYSLSNQALTYILTIRFGSVWRDWLGYYRSGREAIPDIFTAYLITCPSCVSNLLFVTVQYIFLFAQNLFFLYVVSIIPGKRWDVHESPRHPVYMATTSAALPLLYSFLLSQGCLPRPWADSIGARESHTVHVCTLIPIHIWRRTRTVTAASPIHYNMVHAWI